LEDIELYFRPEFVRTVPTESNEDEMHAASMRLDYILASVPVATYCNSSYVDINEKTSIISDHFPVISKFCFQEEVSI